MARQATVLTPTFVKTDWFVCGMLLRSSVRGDLGCTHLSTMGPTNRPLEEEACGTPCVDALVFLPMGHGAATRFASPSMTGSQVLDTTGAE